MLPSSGHLASLLLLKLVKRSRVEMNQKENHVVSVNKNGKSQIEYFACKHFVELSPFDRRKTLYEKGFCGKCLRPGMTRGLEHDCDQKFLCKNTYKNERGEVNNCLNHVLVCGFHANEKRNMELFLEYKNEFI